MKIFMTGATGYLGERIVHYALKQGHEVRALCRNAPMKCDRNNAIEYVNGDLLNTASYKDAMHGCDALIHTAGLVSIWQRDASDFRRMNVEGTRGIMQTAAQCGVKRMIHTSSFFALGPTTGKPVYEDWQNHNCTGYKPTHYAQSKHEADRWLRGWVKDGHDVISLYPALIYGPGKATQGNHITKMMDDFIHRRLPGIPGSGTFRWTFSYVEDVAKGHIQALENGRAGEKYILGGEDATLLELFEILELVTQLKSPRLKIPFSLLRMIGYIERWRARMSSNYIPKLTPDTVDVYQQHWRYSSQKAISEIGYTRTPLKIGIIKTVESLGFTLPSERHSIL